MIALVTGASSGIGRDIARSLAKHGINVIITARRRDRLAELKEELTTKYGVKVMCISADLSDEKQCIKLYNTVKKYNIDILINNAGFGVFGKFCDTDLESELGMLNVNVRAFHILFKLFLKDFRERGCGYILNTASAAGFLPGPYFSSYYASKAYVVRMTQAVAEELKRLHMPVVVLANRNDFCHPFAYGGYMKEHIPGAELREIPDKDADATGHRQSVNAALRYLLSLVYGQEKTGGEAL